MTWQPKGNIVVPVDFSDESGAAIDTALEIAESRASVHLLHVLYPLDSVSPGVVWGNISDESREKEVRQYFDDFLKKKNVSGVTVAVRLGNPGLEISDYASSVAAELIVIPSHGRHGVKRLVLGSVAERVIRHANCSVLVLRRGDAE